MIDLITTSQILEKTTNFVNWNWEQFISTGLVVREMKDRSQWLLGKLALGIETKYGQDKLGEFAKGIGCNYASLRVYRWVAKNFKNLNQLGHLPYFAYQLTAGTENPREWIDKAIENNWTTGQLAREIDKAKGSKKRQKTEQAIKCPNCGFTWNKKDT